MAHYQQKKDKTGRRETALGMETGERERGREVETDQSPEILDRRKTDKHPHTPLETHCEGEKTWSTCDCHSVASLCQWMVSGGITEPVTIQVVSLRRWLLAGGFTGQWECLLVISPSRWVPTGGITKLVSAYWQVPTGWVPTGGITKLVSAYWQYHQAGECLLAVSLVSECLHRWVSKWLLVESVSNYWQCHQVATGDVTVSEWLVVVSLSQWVATGGVTESVSGHCWCHWVANGGVTESVSGYWQCTQVIEWLLVVSMSQWVAGGGVIEWVTAAGVNESVSGYWW